MSRTILNRSSRTSRRGMTVVELSLSLGLLSMIVGLAAMVGDSGRSVFVQTSTTSEVEARVKTTLDRVAAELEMATLSSLDPQLDGVLNDTDSLLLQQVVDIDAGAVVLGELLQVSFEQDPSDAADGLDNDGDGLVDEGCVVMVRDVGGLGEISVTLCTDVRRYLEGESAGGGDDNGNGLTDERGFVIERDGDLLTLRLSLESVRYDGRVTTRTGSTSVLLRN
jgi:hypothetical protein